MPRCLGGPSRSTPSWPCWIQVYNIAAVSPRQQSSADHISSIMKSFAFVVLACLVAAIAYAEEDTQKSVEEEAPTTEKKLFKKDVTNDLSTAPSYGLGYGLSYPYYGYGGLGGLSHGLGSGGYGGHGGHSYGLGSGGYGGHGGYGKAFVLPVYNYGYGGLGYGGYGGGYGSYGGYGKGGYGGYPYGYSSVSLGGYSPWGSSYYSYPYGSSYYNGHGHHGGYGGYY
ncbi:unnamed protein product [Nezara viridula]|uniref:Uncharacterized protein n=1 Tax=Nezara viridula TaxID=85310 RepID=A0A9P0HF18_NEZVI|nr:unnamed protein product [Nezara viridula]